jgi:hypothetical protein
MNKSVIARSEATKQSRTAAPHWIASLRSQQRARILSFSRCGLSHPRSWHRTVRNVAVTAATRFGRARLSALRRGTRQAVTSGSASGCAYRNRQRLAPLQAPFTSEAPRVPIVVPGGQGPKPPGSGPLAQSIATHSIVILKNHNRKVRCTIRVAFLATLKADIAG